ncbi:hypothetical protein WDU94_012354 [Cyamophila willieti]
MEETCNEVLRKKAGKRTNREPAYWWTTEISELRKKCLRKKRILTRLNRREDSAQRKEEARSEYRQAKRELSIEIKHSKENCWAQLCEEVENDVWGLGYKIVTKKLHPKPIKFTPELERDILTTLFPQSEIEEWEPTSVNEDSVPAITKDELATALLAMKCKKAPGQDMVTTEILKVAGLTCPDHLLKVFNNILTSGKFPSDWKTAKVVLLRKPGKPEFVPSSYRPLCLLNTSVKLLESILTRRLIELLGEDGLSQNQFGFRPARSTVDAIKTVYEIADGERKRRRSRRRKLCLLITVDIRNAFGTAPMSAGVPTGSVIAPTLWNIFYDGVLRLDMPEGVTLVGYADDLAVMVTAKTEAMLEGNANQALQSISEWLGAHGLQLAPEKTEAALLIGKKMCGTINLFVDGARVEVKNEIRYLGVILDKRLNFGPHVQHVSVKAANRVGALVRLMPRRTGPSLQKRKLLYRVVESTIVYAAPIWKDICNVELYQNKLLRVQRSMLLRITQAYRTTSSSALQVLAGIPPIPLIILERAEGFGRSNQQDLQYQTMEAWQEKWNTSRTGEWTRVLIPDIRPWTSRGSGELSFHLTQILTGHGCFRFYLHRFGIENTPRCWFCQAVDDAEHTFFQCERWVRVRRETEEMVRRVLTPQNMIQVMMESRENWGAIERMARLIMTEKEEEERRRKRNNS